MLTMKFVQVCLIISLHICVITAKRRRVRFMNCPSTKTNSHFLTITPARSMIECSVVCLNDPHCLSASYCKTDGAYTCQLSGFYTDGSCSESVVDGGCSQTVMMNPCENAGTFYPENRTCHCVEGFAGDYCQRRYRDCSEAPRYTYNLIQPFGSEYIFEWKCHGIITYATELYASVHPHQLHTWQKVREGILMQYSFYFLGLEALHQLTMQGVYDMFVRLFNLSPRSLGFVWYRNFRVDSAEEGYALHWDKVEQDNMFYPEVDYLLDGLGAEGDATMSLNGARFGTFDNDVNDCVRAHNVSWWYNPLNCTMLIFDPDGLYWPINRNGSMEFEKFEYATLGFMPVYWHTEDDLFL